MRILILAAAAWLIAAPAGAQMFPEADLVEMYFTRSDPIRVVYYEDVTDGCRPRRRAIESTIIERLFVAGLTPTEAPVGVFPDWVLEMTAAGGESKYEDRSPTGYCNIAVHISFTLKHPFRLHDEPHREVLLSIPALQDVHAVGARKSRARDEIEDAVAEIMDEFAREILKAMER